VAFSSRASTLDGTDTNTRDDIFVHDRISGETRRVSLAWNGDQGNGHSQNPLISADGRHIAFISEASNLIPSDANGVSDLYLVRNPLAP
jgi:Tol biopolymer transport system component